MKELRRHPALLIATLLFALAVVALLVLPGWKRRGTNDGRYLPATATALAAEPDPWMQAAEKVKEDRGEPSGKQAKVDTPQELQHYSDTRRFLAVQVAEVKKYGLETPQDLVDLGAMLKRGELVSLPPVTENYILFGVGGNTDKQPFTRYENGESISLFSETGLQHEYARIAASRAKFESEIAGLSKELSAVNKRDRSRRVEMQAEIVEKGKALKAERDEQEMLDRVYGNAEKRQQLFREYETLESMADGFFGRKYDLEDGSARQDLKVRLLSSLRPEALKVLEDIAASYRQKFQRPLPITSLVRPDEYQLELSKKNPNATRIETPPHSTGLAFDILNRFMTAEEQAYVMAYLARLKDEGRIEVLRENRDHYHVFAFIDGLRPNEDLISASLSKTATPKAARETHHSEKKTEKTQGKDQKAKRAGVTGKRR